MSHDRRPAARPLRLEQVYRALQALAPERADALVLRVFNRLSVAEVAQIMGTSQPAVKTLVHQAMRDLRERLASQSEAEP